MRLLENCCSYEVQTAEGWVPVRWEQLDVGDVIRCFNPDGTPQLDPLVPLHMTVSKLPCLQVLRIDEVAVREVMACCKVDNVDGAVDLCFEFIEGQIAVGHLFLVKRFMEELNNYVWLPIQSQAVPTRVMVGILRGTSRIKDELAYYWTNFRSLTIERIKDEKGDVDRVLRGLL